MEGQLKALIPPPAASQNAAPIIPGPGLRSSFSDQANKSSLVGTLAYLGSETVLPADCWVKQSQPISLNSGAHNHPVMILARQDNLVLCAPCTSWSGKTPQEKWSNAPQVLDNILYSHMELLPTDSIADCATSALGGLFHSGRAMEKRTFMSLQRAFWTEAALLEEYAKGGNRRLSADSAAMACWAYSTAHAWRQQNGISEEFSVKSRTPSPPAECFTQRGNNGWSRPTDDCKLPCYSTDVHDTQLTHRTTAARRTTASKGGIYKAGGNNWRAKSEGKRKSGGFMGKENWRAPRVAA